MKLGLNYAFVSSVYFSLVCIYSLFFAINTLFLRYIFEIKHQKDLVKGKCSLLHHMKRPRSLFLSDLPCLEDLQIR